MSSESELTDQMERYDPPAIWEGLISYYGSLAARPGWEGLRKQFDFVKQLSTSSMATLFHPSIIDDALFMAAQPITSIPAPIPSIKVDANASGSVILTRYDRNAADGKTVACRRVDALHILTKMTATL